MFILYLSYFLAKHAFIYNYFKKKHLFIKIPKYAKLCKIKLNVSDLMSTETNLLPSLKCVRLKEKICKSHKHPNPSYDL